MEQEWRRLKTARSSAKRSLTLVLNRASEVLLTEGSEDDVKKTYQDLIEVFEAFYINCENFKSYLKDDDDLEESEAYFDEA